jgi:hypothetical protein
VLRSVPGGGHAVILSVSARVKQAERRLG